MKVKIFTVYTDEDFRARVGSQARSMSGNEYLEEELQAFLDQHPHVEIRHVHYSAMPILPRMPSWSTTNQAIEWEIEKSVVIFYEEGDR